jgi:D-arabinose 1-dehydrogenase-like Zn-dependent alcohol dehydrogenase
MGFRTIAISHGKDKEELARQLGAHEYVDTNAGSAAQGLNRLGGADVVLATAPYADAIADTAGGLKPRGKLLIVAAPFEPLKVSVMALLTGKTIAGPVSAIRRAAARASPWSRGPKRPRPGPPSRQGGAE